MDLRRPVIYLFSELLDLLREASLVRQVNLSDV